MDIGVVEQTCQELVRSFWSYREVRPGISRVKLLPKLRGEHDSQGFPVHQSDSTTLSRTRHVSNSPSDGVFVPPSHIQINQHRYKQRHDRDLSESLADIAERERSLRKTFIPWTRSIAVLDLDTASTICTMKSSSLNDEARHRLMLSTPDSRSLLKSMGVPRSPVSTR